MAVHRRTAGGTRQRTTDVLLPHEGPGPGAAGPRPRRVPHLGRKSDGLRPGHGGGTPEAQTRSTGGGAVRGGALGAAGGAAIGAIAGNAGRGAAIGAVGGGLMGGMRRNSQNQQSQDLARAARARQDAQRAEYQRALRACMQGKGYSVG